MFNFLSKLIMDEKLKEIENLCQEIEAKIRYVNHGGCCVAAVLIAERLQPHFPTRIRVGDDFGGTYTNIEHALEDIGATGNLTRWNDNDVHFGHVIVEVECQGKLYHIDSTGVHKAKKNDPTFGFSLYQGSLDLKVAKQLAADTGWNCSFDRNQIPLLQQIINGFFDCFDEMFA